MLSVKQSTYPPDLEEEIKYHFEEGCYHLQQIAIAKEEIRTHTAKANEHMGYYKELRNKFNSECLHV